MNNKTISPDNITFLYENVESLSFRIVDYGNVVFLPILVVFSIITNTLTLIVLTQPIQFIQKNDVKLFCVVLNN